MRVFLIGLFISLITFASAQACDPEDLAREYRSLCAVTHEGARDMVLKSAVNEGVKSGLIAKINQAKALCENDKYDDGMRLSLHTARALGQAEIQASPLAPVGFKP
jgi:hypothetical protein